MQIIQRSTVLRGVRSLLCLLTFATIAWGQDRGSISGRVTDNSGALVAGAAVAVKNPATGLTQNAVSSGEGAYTFQGLPAGEYNLNVESKGFRGANVTGLTVTVNTNTRFDVKLEVGTVQETVEVQGVATLLQTDRSDLGKVIDNRTIEALPLFSNGALRSNLAFATLTPGANLSVASDPDGGFSISGGPSNGNSMLVDGGEHMSERRNDPQMRVISSEGIQEFKVQNSAYSAEYGRTSNGILNYTTKSGTNEFHASLFAQIRQQALDAKGFFYTFPPPGSQTVHNQNLQAASVGGPVWIPKLFNGRNKAFFFFSGERSRAKDVVANSLITLPVAAIRQGDFRNYVDASGKVIPIYDPFDANGAIVPNANQRQQVQCNGVLNVICPSRINPVASVIQGYFPLPSNPNLFFNNNNGVSNGSRDPGENEGVYAIKGDYNKSDKLRFSGSFSRQYNNELPLNLNSPSLQNEGFNSTGDNKFVHFNTDYIFTPNLLNHFSFNYTQKDLTEGGNQRLGSNTDAYASALRAPGNPSYLKSPNYTYYSFQNFPATSSFVSTASPGRTYDFKDGMTWIKGRHILKFGGEFLRVNYGRTDCNACDGRISFDAGGTGNPGVSTSGLDYASFLLGVSGSAFFNYGAEINYVYPYYAAYIQDDFKVNNKLTLNIGLRYDLPLARREPHNQSSNFDPKAPNPSAGNLPGALIFIGDGPGRAGRKTLLEHRSLALGPRFGFAYQITPSTVVRGGGAITYDANREDGNADGGVQGFGGNFNVPQNYFSTGISYLLPNSSNASQAGFLPYKSLIDAGLPPIVNPGAANYGSPSFFSDGRVGQFYDYNFTVEHSFGAATLLRGSFHANYGNKLKSSQNFNQLDPKYIALYGSLLSAPLSDPRVQALGLPLPFAGYRLNNTLAQALDPFPQYAQGFSGTTNGGHSTYNALETSFQHNFSQGLFTQVSYTRSKLFVDNTSPNVYVVNREKDLSTSDRPNILIFAYIYDVPLGRGKKFGTHLNSVVDAAVGGWRLSGVQKYQNGAPLGVSCGQNLYGAGASRCTSVSGQSAYNDSWNPGDPSSSYINKSAFIQPPNGVFGNVGAVIPSLRQPFQLNEDVSVSKIFNLFSEKRTLEFRGSAFNIANRHLLGGLNTTVTNSSFGRFTNPQSNLPRNIEFSLRLKF
jgi:hypothetical protein